MTAAIGVLAVLLAMVCHSAVHCTGSSPNCLVPTFDEVEETLELSLQGFARAISRPDSVEVNLTDFNPTCLSVSLHRDEYRVATVLVLFTFAGGLSSFGQTCVPNQPCTALFNMECLTDTTTWTYNRLLVLLNVKTVVVSDEAFNAPPRLDCGLCNDRANSLDPNAHDLDTNCIVCNEACQGVGLSYCTGLTTNDCCGFYDGNTCTDQCPAGSQPDTDFNCIQGCDLECVFGRPNSTCNECVCDPGYTDVNCSTNINDCEGVSCGNGTCVDLVNGFQCNCSDDFIGVNCDTRIDDCVGVDCNNGSCVDGIRDFTCSCDPGFTGATCNTSIDDCVNNGCQNGAACIDGFQSYTCECTANFIGEFCELCGLPNCTTCSNIPYMCSECDIGFLNSNNGVCQETCSLIMCENNGTCVPASDRFEIASCTCVDGFSGVFCGTNIDECANAQCANDGTCVDDINSFTCICPPGFTGDLCDTPSDPCRDNPCVNGGACNAVDSLTFTCTCLDNFQGKTCKNCTIENCDECSQSVAGSCNNCASNHRRGTDGTCFQNSCTTSPPVDASQCDYYFNVVRLYEELTSTCSEPITTEIPDLPPDATALDTYNANNEIYLDLYQSWLTTIGEFGVETSSISLPSPDQLVGKDNVEIWRIRVEIWYNSLLSYIEYMRGILGVLEADFDGNAPEVDFENDDTEEIYEKIVLYSAQVSEFYAGIFPRQEGLCAPPGS